MKSWRLLSLLVLFALWVPSHFSTPSVAAFAQNSIIVVGLMEEYDRYSVLVLFGVERWIDHTMHRRNPSVVGPLLHQIAELTMNDPSMTGTSTHSAALFFTCKLRSESSLRRMVRLP